MVNTEKPDYANWISKKLLITSGTFGVILAFLFFLSFLLPGNVPLIIFRILIGLISLFVLSLSAYMTYAYRLLSYDGGGVQGKILDNVLRYLIWDGNGKLLDIGCGSGALTIKAAKKYPAAQVFGMDYWGAMWDYAQNQCETNARLEDVAKRTVFQKGDAAHLDFPDAEFDAAVSNFVFHEVRTQPDKLELIREALRVLKPGAPFAFEDIFYNKKNYPNFDDMLALLSKEATELHFVDTRQNNFVPKFLKTPLIAGEMGLIYGTK